MAKCRSAAQDACVVSPSAGKSVVAACRHKHRQLQQPHAKAPQLDRKAFTEEKKPLKLWHLVGESYGECQEGTRAAGSSEAAQLLSLVDNGDGGAQASEGGKGKQAALTASGSWSTARMKMTYFCPGSRALFSKLS